MKSFKINYLFLVVIILLGLFLSACDDRSKKVTAPIPESDTLKIAYIGASPLVVYTNDDNSISTISCKVTDLTNQPEPNVLVKFKSTNLNDSTSIGNIIGEALTDEQGIATTSFKAGNIELTNATGDTVKIVASVGTSLTKTFTKIIMKTAPSPDDSLKITGFEVDYFPNPEDTVVYANDDGSYIDISIFVKNNKVPQEAIEGLTVNFSCNVNNAFLIFQAITDNQGVARSIFKAGHATPGSAIITARIGQTVMARRTVTIVRQPIVQSVSISYNAGIPWIVNQENNIQASAQYDNGHPVKDSTNITFTAPTGVLLYNGMEYISSVTAKTVNGSANVTYRAPLNSGIVEIKATCSSKDDTENINIQADTPKTINMATYTVDDTTATNQTYIDTNENHTLRVRTFLSDQYNNPIFAKVVRYTTTLGTITSSDTTNSIGYAEAIFTAGMIPGNAQITATCDTITAKCQVNIISDEVQSMQFIFTGNIDINIAGTGGTESANIDLKLLDSNGNIVMDSKRIKFEIIHNTEGPNATNATLNGDGTTGTIVPVFTVNGIASVAVLSGLNAGIVELKATLQEPDPRPGHEGDWIDTEIMATKNNIIVHAGPPHRVTFAIGGNNTGVSVGAGNYKVQVSAMVTDEWGNPCDYGTAVTFQIVPPVTGDPDSLVNATIEAVSYIGNWNVDGDSTAGTAYTTLIYDGSNSNDSFTIKAIVGGIQPQTTLVLPMQNATVEAVVVPSHYDFGNGNTATSGKVMIKLIIRDDQGNLLHNVPVTFGSDFGYFDNDLAPNGQWDPGDELAYSYTEDDPDDILVSPPAGVGALNKYIYFKKASFNPPGPGALYLDTPVNITITLLGAGTNPFPVSFVVRVYA